MPVAEPPENLAERVLRQAERRMLSGHPDVDEISAAAASGEAVPSVPAPHFLRQWRMALVLTATLAASVLLTIWLPFRPGEKVAVVPPQLRQRPHRITKGPQRGSCCSRRISCSSN